MKRRARRQPPVAEDVYRQRLWRKVQQLMEERGESKTWLAKQWRSQQSRVTRLSELEVPTTLGNLDSLAAAFDIELPDLLWPLLAQKEIARAEKVAIDRHMQGLHRLFERERERLLDALESEPAARLFEVVGILAREAPKELETVLAMLEAFAKRRQSEDSELKRREAGLVGDTSLPTAPGPERVDERERLEITYNPDALAARIERRKRAGTNRDKDQGDQGTR